jgi:hypothetical protein
VGTSSPKPIASTASRSQPEFEDIVMPGAARNHPAVNGKDADAAPSSLPPGAFRRGASGPPIEPRKVDRRWMWWLIGGGLVAVFAATRRK